MGQLECDILLECIETGFRVCFVESKLSVLTSTPLLRYELIHTVEATVEFSLFTCGHQMGLMATR